MGLKSISSLLRKLAEFPLDLLHRSTMRGKAEDMDAVARKVSKFFRYYKVRVARVVPVSIGPRVMRFALGMLSGEFISQIEGVKAELALWLRVPSVSVAQREGALYLDVPRKEYDVVRLIDVLMSDGFESFEGGVPVPIGMSPDGDIVVDDLVGMPHMLVGGASGSGKSVFLHSLICSLMYKLDPQSIQMVLVDTKKIEFSLYRGFTFGKVFTEVEEIEPRFEQLIVDMDERYDYLSERGVRDISESDLPFIVVVVDELADLLMHTGKAFNKNMVTLLAKGRAVGMHFVCATQRPSADVIAGIMKANMPARLTFKTASSVDSQVIIGASGAEDLLGKGDGLYEGERIQGSLVTPREIRAIVGHFQ